MQTGARGRPNRAFLVNESRSHGLPCRQARRSYDDLFPCNMEFWSSAGSWNFQTLLFLFVRFPYCGIFDRKYLWGCSPNGGVFVVTSPGGVSDMGARRRPDAGTPNRTPLVPRLLETEFDAARRKRLGAWCPDPGHWPRRRRSGRAIQSNFSIEFEGGAKRGPRVSCRLPPGIRDTPQCRCLPEQASNPTDTSSNRVWDGQ